jgi:hypothetical protein
MNDCSHGFSVQHRELRFLKYSLVLFLLCTLSPQVGALAVGDGTGDEWVQTSSARVARFAVATLVSGGTSRHEGQDGYTLGAVALAGSLYASAIERHVDLVAMVTSDVSVSNRFENTV